MTSAPDLGANYSGAETCHHGANSNGAVVWVQFLEGYYQGRICEKLSKKGKKNKNLAMHGDSAGDQICRKTLPDSRKFLKQT
jgi:hypothetical protein